VTGWLLLIAGAWLAGAALTAFLAHAKRRSPVRWGLLGLWWSLWALILVAALRPAAPKDGAGASPLRWWANRKNIAYWLVYSAAFIAIAIAVNVALAMLLSYRGPMSPSVLQGDIQTTLLNRGVVATVTCPSGQPWTGGTSFLCTITKDGQMSHVRIDVLNGEGAYTWTEEP
jgi:hypothetical protein